MGMEDPEIFVEYYVSFHWSYAANVGLFAV